MLVLAVALALSPYVASEQEFTCPEHGYPSCQGKSLAVERIGSVSDCYEVWEL
jgi:hypothetical protein